jgi:hypothetical protein
VAAAICLWPVAAAAVVVVVVMVSVVVVVVAMLGPFWCNLGPCWGQIAAVFVFFFVKRNAVQAAAV